MITIENYLEKTKGVDFASLPEALKKGHEFLKKVTINFHGRAAYDSHPGIKKTIDLYLSKLESFLATQKKTPAPTPKKAQPKPKTEVKKTPKVAKKAPAHSPPKAKKATKDEDVEFVERIPEELRFMKRYINMDSKTKTYDQILSFINSLQRAILEKRIRKTSPYAKEVEYMQKKLIEVYNGRKGESVLVRVAGETMKKFRKLVDGERIMKSVQLIKRFISLHGKSGVKEKAVQLIKAMIRARDKRQITQGDIYESKIQEIYKLLHAFVNDVNQTRLAMDKESLNGLIGLVGGCGCEGLGNIDVPEEIDEKGSETPSNQSHVMNSMDFANMKFLTIGLKGKWLDLMGDPAPGFSAMVYGKPKMGKSFLCIDFAGYLSRFHGKVLYVAREEGLDATLQNKLNETNVKNPNLFISDNLPDDLSQYDFIFLDSVNKLDLSPADLDKLRKDNPKKSFVFVFQTTKDGNFKGKNEFQHDVDIVIEVYEKGKASQFGRYNQGGEMDIFNNTNN